LVIPTKTLATIKEVAATRDMSPEALTRFYIGEGLRQDVRWLFDEKGAIDDAPPEDRLPNAATRRALKDAEARRGLTSFATPDDLFDDLGRSPPRQD
jgi:hypothetical protein